MKIISFDVGIRNMAYCILTAAKPPSVEIQQWGIMNLTDEAGPKAPPAAKPPCCMCKRLAKMTLLDGRAFCMKHTAGFILPMKGLPQLKKTELAEKLRQAGLPVVESASKTEMLDILHSRILSPLAKPTKTAAGEIGLVDIGRRLAAKLADMSEELQGLTHVVIENQISPIATRMKTIQGMLAQYFIVCFPNVAVEFVSSHNKLKDIDVGDSSGSGGSYAKNKKMSVERVEELIAEKEWCEFFRAHTKKDDLADCLLQGLWFVRKINS